MAEQEKAGATRAGGVRPWWRGAEQQGATGGEPGEAAAGRSRAEDAEVEVTVGGGRGAREEAGEAAAGGRAEEDRERARRGGGRRGRRQGGPARARGKEVTQEDGAGMEEGGVGAGRRRPPEALVVRPSRMATGGPRRAAELDCGGEGRSRA